MSRFVGERDERDPRDQGPSEGTLTPVLCWCGHEGSKHSPVRGICRAPGGCGCNQYRPPQPPEGTLVVSQSKPGEWVCPTHGTGHWIPAGISKKTGRAYPAFRACDAKLPDGSWCPEAAPFRSPRATNSAAKVEAAATTLVQVAAQAPGECRVFEPASGNAYGQGHCITCGGPYAQHARPIETRVARNRGGRGAGAHATRSVATLTHVEHRPPNTTVLGYGWEAGKPGIPAVVQIDEVAAAALRMMLHDQSWGGKVSVWVDESDWVVSDRLGDEVVLHMDNTVKPAQYTAASIGVPGRKPTLVTAQDVLILRTYQGNVPGDALVQCDVVYDPTDYRAGECEWKAGTIITGVNSADLQKRVPQT